MQQFSIWLLTSNVCSRQAVTGCLTYPAASSEELVALDGVSRSASRFCDSKNELKNGSLAPKCGPKNGTSFWAFGNCAGTGRLQKRVRIRGPLLAPLFTLFKCRFWQRMVASRYCCEGHNLSQFLSFLRSHHDRIQRQRQQQCCAAMQLSKRSKIIRHCIYISTYLHIYIFKHLHIHIFTYLHISILICSHTYILTYLHVWIFNILTRLFLHSFFLSFIPFSVHSFVHALTHSLTHSHGKLLLSERMQQTLHRHAH